MNVRERERGSTHGQRDWSARLKLMFMKLITNSWEIWAHSQLICHRASWLMWAADGRSVGFFFFCFVQSVFLCLWPTLLHLKLKKNEAVAPWTETRVNVSLSNYSVVPPLAARASCRRIEQRRSELNDLLMLQENKNCMRQQAICQYEQTWGCWEANPLNRLKYSAVTCRTMRLAV